MRGGLTSVTMPRRAVESTKGWPGWMRERLDVVTITKGVRLMILTD